MLIIADCVLVSSVGSARTADRHTPRPSPAIIALACTLNGYALFVLLLDEDVSPGLALIGGAALQIFPHHALFLL